jgi:hypothetical protein
MCEGANLLILNRSTRWSDFKLVSNAKDMNTELLYDYYHHHHHRRRRRPS